MSEPYPLPADLVGRIRRKLMQSALYLVHHDEEEAVDLVHETLLRVPSLMKAYQGRGPPWPAHEANAQEARLQAYFWRCLVGQWSNGRRKADRRRALLDRHMQQRIRTDERLAVLLRIEVEELLSMAPDADADLLYRRFILDAPYARIADEKGVTEVAVRVRVTRALQRLRNRIQGG